MVEVQNAIYRAGGRASPVDDALVRERYLDGAYRVACTVAAPEGRVLGFQSLNRSWPDNPYQLLEGYGSIGTHVPPSAGRRRIGRRLFAISLPAAKPAALRHIDASIAANTGPALAYYAAMGITPYRQGDDPYRQ